jgi:hypothetical protein
MSASEGESSKKGPLALVGAIAATVAALALFITNLTTLRDAWCNSIGTFCASPVKWAYSDEVYVFSGGTKDNNSDECKDHETNACVRPDPKTTLMPDTARFEASERSGAVYIDGNTGTSPNPNPIGTSNIDGFFSPTRLIFAANWPCRKNNSHPPCRDGCTSEMKAR